MSEFQEQAEEGPEDSKSTIDVEAAESDPANWVAGDDNGYAYYYNNITHKSVWEKPECMHQVAKRGFLRQLSSLSDEKIALEPPPLSLRIFHQFDKDNSGYIDAEELQVMAYHFGVWLCDDALQLALMTMDQDQNGEISYEEFLSWYQDSSFASLKLDDETLNRRNVAALIFKKYDTDNSGAIDRAEFMGMHAELWDAHVTTDSLEEVMRDIDMDNDGLIRFNEFCAWLDRQQQTPLKPETLAEV